MAPLSERVNTKNRIERKYRAIGVKSEKTVDVLLEQSHICYDLVQDRFKALDGKAATLISIVTTGFGAIALLGDPSKVPSNGSWLYLALASLAASFALALISQMPQGTQNPDISPYLIAATAADADNASRIKFDLASAWVRDAAILEHATVVKGRLIFAGTLALFLAVVFLAINYRPYAGEKPTPTINVNIVSSPAPVLH